MAEQTEPVSAKAPIGDSYDESLDLMNLPDPPWTAENLGEEAYGKLARVSGAFNPVLDPKFRPALDPRSFASGRAAQRARLFGISMPPADVRNPADFEAWFNGQQPEHQHAINALNIDAEKIQAAIDAKLPAPAGTPRASGAKPLTPAKLQFSKRMF